MSIPVEYEVEISSLDENKGNLIRENFVSFKHALESGVPMDKYFEAVKFVTNKSIGMSNVDAYADACADKYAILYDKWVNKAGLKESEFRSKKLSPIVSYFSSSSLVQSMMKAIRIPTKIMNMGLLQEALDVEADLMRNARSEIVREKAAKTLIEYLGDESGEEEKVAEERKDERINKYEELLASLAQAKLDSIKNGGDVYKITNKSVIDVETE